MDQWQFGIAGVHYVEGNSVVDGVSQMPLDKLHVSVATRNSFGSRKALMMVVLILVTWVTEEPQIVRISFCPSCLCVGLLETIKKPILPTPYFLLEAPGFLSASQNDL